MSPLVLLLLTAAVPSGPDWFYPGSDDRKVSIVRGGGGDHGSASIGGLTVGLTGRLLAKVDDPARLRALPGIASVEVLPGTGRVVRITPRGDVDELALSRALHERDDVVWCHPDFAMTTVPTALPNDPYVGGQWHLDNVGQRGWTAGVDIKAQIAWSRSIGVGGMAAVIDSGVDLAHPDLRVKSGHDYIGHDEDSSPQPGNDAAPHGTAVSGIIAAIGDNGIGVAGVAYGASLYAIRFVGGNVAMSDFYSAFVEAVDAGAWVINNSWGYGDKCDPIPDLGVYQEVMAYSETMGRGGLGSVVVFAAGNGNCDIGNNGLLAQPEVIAVAATNGDDRREGYSCFGTWIDVAAPSGTILTTDITGKDGYGSWNGDDNYYGFFNGTSAATPVVSGVLLLMLASNPRLTAADARRVLRETAVKVDVENGKYDASGFSQLYGWGRVDAGAAVTAVANAAPSAPVILAPTREAFVDRVVLQWLPSVDADHDVLTYQVAWKVAGQDTPYLINAPAGQTRLDITHQVAVGQSVTFTVSALDLWGPGAASAPATFLVVDRPLPEPPPAAMMTPGGCACSLGRRGPGGGCLALVVALLVLCARRRAAFRSGLG